MLPCYLLPAFFFYTSLPLAPADRHPAQAGLTFPALLPLYRPLGKEPIGIGHLHPTFSSFSLFFSIYSLGRIYTYIYRARTIY